ncbi:hypothetical protein OAN85_00200 [Candidatus Pseudothioglobus singularis]|nr:hypothetical protein [Candidatus Pseudothioglobus singularis]
MSKNQNSLGNLISVLQPQIATFCLIVFVTFINGPSYPFVGNLIWLPLGAMSLCFLLFDFKVVLAALLATHFSDVWIHSQSFFSQVTLLQSVAGVVAPIFAIACMRFFKLSNFFDEGKVVFQHLLFLAILTALFNTIISFFTSSYIASKDETMEQINATVFIKNYLIGDVLGCLVVLFFAALVAVPVIKYFSPKNVQMD